MIPGLRYVSEYLDAVTHDSLLASVDEGAWRDFGERRAQIYGYSYHYTKGGLYRVEDLPPWAEDLSARLVRDGLMPDAADQLIVNDYAAGQGIQAHVDAPLFTDTIISVSLGSNCVMEFTNEAGDTEARFLEPRSTLVIGGEARHGGSHDAASIDELSVGEKRIGDRRAALGSVEMHTCESTASHVRSRSREGGLQEIAP